MVRKRIDPEEYEIEKKEKTPTSLLREYLESFLGENIAISSNIDKRSASIRKIHLYHISQSYDEEQQVYSLEDPNLDKKDHPKIVITKEMEVRKEEEKIIITYKRHLPFRAMRQRAIPDVEVYIQKIS